jgi:hypothetical protein
VPGVQLTQAGGAGVINAGGTQNPTAFGTVITGAVCILAAVGTVPTTFQWGQAVPPLSTTAQLSTTTGASPTFTPDVPGLYDITLTDQLGNVYTLQLQVQKTAVTVFTGPFSPANVVPAQIQTPPVGQTLFCDSSNNGALTTKNSLGVVTVLAQLGAAGGDIAGTLPTVTVVAITGAAGIAAVHATTLQWDTLLAPIIKGADDATAGGTANPFTIQAPNATGTGSTTGGALTLQSGSGTTPGVINLKFGATQTLALAKGSDFISATAGVRGMQFIAQAIASSYIQLLVAGTTPTGIQLDSDTLLFRTSASSAKGNWNNTGLRVGDGTAATEKLEVTGNVKFDVAVASPKIFQADNTTNSATGAALTVQAQNATGTSSNGGALNLQAGAGATAPGNINMKAGANTLGTWSWGAGSTGYTVSGAASAFSLIANAGTSQYVVLQVAGTSPLGLFFDCDGINFRTSASASKGLFDNTGLRIGDGTTPGRALNVGVDSDTTNVNIRVNGKTATSATTGANGAPPAQVAGYVWINVKGTDQKFAYYNV